MKKSVIENQFKEKINAREITPSTVSWDRLDAMLTVSEKPKRSFKWMYVAASILGFLLIGNLYFSQDQKDNGVLENSVVTSDINAVPETDTKPIQAILAEKIKVTRVVEEQLALNEIKSETGSYSVLSNKENQAAEKEIIPEQIIPIINQKAEQKIVQRKSSYVNADELLASVDNASPKKSSMVTQSNVKVNSNDLLTQVDGELDLTFREKAIKTVNQNFKAVKLALSNRNSE